MTSTAPSTPSRGRPTAARAAVGAGVVAVVLVLVLVVTVLLRGGDDEDAAPSGPPSGAASEASSEAPSDVPSEPLTTPLSEVDTGTLRVQRTAFCDLVEPAALAAVLGGPPADVRTYDNGDRAQLAAGLTDIAHEHGCRWRRGRTVLRAWVFVPPVTVAEARRLVADTRDAPGCDVRRGAPAYGSPSVARTCAVGRGESAVEASYRGLFGDAWLSCSLTTPTGSPGEADAVLDEAGAWCAEVALAASTTPAS